MHAGKEFIEQHVTCFFVCFFTYFFSDGDFEGHADHRKVLSWNILPGFRLPTHNSHKKQISHRKLFFPKEK